MRFRSPMKHRARWLLVAAAVLAWGLQWGPAHELTAQGRPEAQTNRAHFEPSHAARPHGTQASWESLFAAGRW